MDKSAQSQFRLKSDVRYLYIGIIGAVTGCAGLFLIIPLFLEMDGSWMEQLAGSFLFMWLFAAWLCAIVSFYEYSKRLLIDDEGVSYRTLFYKKHLDWSEVQDYGLSYYGKTRVGTDVLNTYVLYFAKEKQKSRNQYSKSIKMDAAKIQVIGAQYEVVLSVTIPFCKCKTPIEPFVPSDDWHFI